ncbi:MAG: uracil phosphoribosyltransferase [Paenibacillaceae bacterium]
MGTVVVCDHPLIQHKLTYIRDQRTNAGDFRALVDEVATLMAYEVTRHIKLEPIEVTTPVTTTTGYVISGRMIGIVPILRAGLGMVDGILKLLPAAKIGHIGLARNPETLQPACYYIKLPIDAPNREFIIIDPMLATGGSANEAIRLLKEKGCTQIRLMCLIAAPEGIAAVSDKHPEVDIYVAAIDEKLNDHGYIVPGLGDAGDRLYGTD